MADCKNLIWNEAHSLLQEWGKWARGTGTKGYPTKLPHMSVWGSEEPGPSITDEDALKIDSIVSSLKTSDQQAWFVAKIHYTKGTPIHRFHYPIGRRKAERLREVVIDAVIESMFCRVDMYTENG